MFLEISALWIIAVKESTTIFWPFSSMTAILKPMIFTFLEYTKGSGRNLEPVLGALLLVLIKDEYNLSRSG